jgi:hypothetical protein
MYLKRYHDIQISNSGVWRILKRLELNRLPASQRHKRHDRRWQRYEKPLPGHRVQLDVKFIDPLAGSRRKHYRFTAIDDCTRLRVLRIYPQLNQKSAIQFLDYVLERLTRARPVACTFTRGPAGQANSSRVTPRSGRFRVTPVRQDQPHHQGPSPASLAVHSNSAKHG